MIVIFQRAIFVVGQIYMQIGIGWFIGLAALALLQAAALTVYKKKSGKKIARLLCGVVLFDYTLFILALTVFSRGVLPEEYRDNNFLISTSFWFLDPNLERWVFIDRLIDDTLNTVLFIPFGFLTSYFFRGKKISVFLSAFAIVMLIEVLQVTTKRGFFELSDIVFNMCGAAIGYLFFYIIVKHRNKESGLEEK